MLIKLKERGVFLIDTYDLPIRVRGNKENEEIIKDNIALLKEKISKLNPNIAEKNIIFLSPRGTKYKKTFKKNFPNSQYFSWKEFRLGNFG